MKTYLVQDNTVQATKNALVFTMSAAKEKSFSAVLQMICKFQHVEINTTTKVVHGCISTILYIDNFIRQLIKVLLTFIWDTVVWYTTARGSNCPINDVIMDSASCIIASEELGLTCTAGCVGRRKTTRPAGCHYLESHHSYLNGQTLPSETTPKFDSGAICAKSSKFMQFLFI